MSRISNLRPQSFVVNYNAVVEYTHTISINRLIVGQTVSDQAAVAHDETGC